MFYDKGNELNIFVRSQRQTKRVLVRISECKHNLYKNTPQGTFNSQYNIRL